MSVMITFFCLLTYLGKTTIIIGFAYKKKQEMKHLMRVIAVLNILFNSRFPNSQI